MQRADQAELQQKFRGTFGVGAAIDDHRLAALKVYLSGGFKPVLYGAPEDNMRERWSVVCQNLGIDFDALEFIEK